MIVSHGYLHKGYANIHFHLPVYAPHTLMVSETIKTKDIILRPKNPFFLDKKLKNVMSPKYFTSRAGSLLCDVIHYGTNHQHTSLTFLLIVSIPFGFGHNRSVYRVTYRCIVFGIFLVH